MNPSEARPAESPVPLPPRVRAALEEFRRRVRTIKLVEGGFVALFGLVVSYLAVFALDRWFDTPSGWRTVIFVTGSLGLVVLLPLKYHRWVWRNRRLEQVARLVRHQHPRFGDHLLGVVELAQNAASRGASRTLVEAAMRQVEGELDQRDLRNAVPHPRHRHWAWAAGIPGAVMLAVLVLLPGAGGNALQRWATPWRPVARYTFAQLEADAGRRVVPYAEPFAVQVGLRPDSPWKPSAALARYRDQAPVETPLAEVRYDFRIPPQTQPGTLAIEVGDARLAIPVEPMSRPALTELQARVRLPAYLDRPGETVEEVRGGTIELVQGSRVAFTARATRELAAALLDDEAETVDGDRLTTRELAVEGATEHQLTWRDGFGLVAREPQILRIEAREDRAPTVVLSRLENNRVVLSTEVLAFEIQAGDDFGLQRLGLEWEGLPDPAQNPEPARGEKLVAAGDPYTDTVTAPATFSAEREQVRPQSLRLRAYAEDYLPGRERSRSPWLIVHVLSPSDHFKWLTARMNQWVSAAQEVHDTELQLHRINAELRALSPEALDEPGRRKQIQDQAAAEMANAAALDSLIETGAGLVQEAVKNREFDPGQLEAWADMLERLETVAGQRMPSVAQLLERAAAAPGQPDAPAEDTDAASPKPPEDAMASADSPTEAGKPGEATNAQSPEETPPAPPPGPSLPAPETEQSLARNDESPSPPPPSSPPPPAGPGIPTVGLAGSTPSKPPPKKAAETAGDLVQQAVEEQEALLDSLGRLAREMKSLMQGFESSTFVKRLMAASRRQLDLADELNDLEGFGLERHQLASTAARETLGAREIAASEVLFTILEDMDAYASRRPSANYSRVLNEMRDTAVVDQVRDISVAVGRNEIGKSTIEAEFWADTLDRWAEQLVDPPDDGDADEEESPEESSGDTASLPPELVVEVLRLINREIQLREETRELDHARPAMPVETVKQQGAGLSAIQAGMADKSRELVGRIRGLPDAQKLQADMQKLTSAGTVMDEAAGLLETPETGAPTIAAISEVIEILLETRRVQNNPTVMKVKTTAASALMLVGIGDDTELATIEERAPGQSTGLTGRALPAEFQQGLDVYFNALEARRSGGP